MKKRELNRKRKRACPNQNDSTPLQQSAQPPDTNSTKEDTALIAYMTNLIELLEHRRVSREEVVAFIKEVRQRGIESFDFSRYIEEKERRPPP